MIRIADLRDGERRPVLGAFLTQLGLLSAHMLLETSRDALFLAMLPASQLPWLYVAIAAVGLGVSEIGRRATAGLRSRAAALRAFLLLGAGLTAALWTVVDGENATFLYVLYVWTALVSGMSVVQLWIYLGEVFTISQAKRLYGGIAAGATLGAVLGSALASAMTQVLPAQHLVLAAAIIIALTALGPLSIIGKPTLKSTPGPGESHREASMLQCLKESTGHPYTLRLATLVIVATATLTLVDYVFKAEVAASVDAADLGRFFAGVNLALGVLSFLVQVALSGLLMSALGVQRSLTLLPLLIIGGAAALLAGAGLVGVLILKGADGTLRHSLHRTAIEVHYVPLGARMRAHAKRFVDLLGQRGAQAATSFAILGVLQLGGGPRTLAVAALACAGLWIFLALRLRGPYLQLFRETLTASRAAQTDPQHLELDMAALEVIFAALSSQDPAEVKAAMNILRNEGRVRLIPPLMLYHPAPSVVLEALECFVEAERRDFLPLTEYLLGHEEPTVRATALWARTQLQPDPVELRRHLREHFCPMVRATALVNLVALGAIDEAEAHDLLAELRSRTDTPVEQQDYYLAEVLRRTPTPAFGPVLVELLGHREPTVRAPAIEAIGRLADPRYIDDLLPHLARRRFRACVRDAFLAIGGPARDALLERLADPQVDVSLRRHIPRVLAHFPARTVAADLLHRYLEETNGLIRYQLLRALETLTNREGDIDLDRRSLHDAAQQSLASAYRSLGWRVSLLKANPAYTPARELLLGVLQDKEKHAIDRTFRLLALADPAADLPRIEGGLRSADRRVRASSQELLESALPSFFRAHLVPLVDDVEDERRLEGGKGLVDPPEEADEASLLADIAAGSGRILGQIVAWDGDGLEVAS